MPIQWGSDTLPKKSSIKWLDSPPTAPPPQPVPQKPSIQWLDEPAPVATPIQPEQPGIVSRAFQSAGQNLVGTATGVIEKMQAGANQDKISAIQRAQALPDDFVEPAQPGIGSMGGYSMPTPGRNKQQILAQAYFDAGITPEQLQALRNQNVALVADADLTAQEREQRAKEQAAIDKAQGYGAIATKTRELGTGALESAVMMAPAVPLALAAAPLGIPAATIAGYTGAIAPAILSTAADSEQRAAEKGISNRGAYVATDVALEAIPSLLIPGGAEKLLAEPAKQAVKTGFKQAMKTLLGETAKEIPEELVTTVGQAMNAQLQGVDPTAASPEKLAQAAFDTTISTIMTMGLVGGKGVGTGAIQSLRGTQPTPPTPPIEPPTPAQAEADAILQASTAPPQPNVPTATPEAQAAPLQSSPPTPGDSPSPSVVSTAQTQNTQDDSLPQEEGVGGDSKQPWEMTKGELSTQKDETGLTDIEDRFAFHVGGKQEGGLKAKDWGGENVVWLKKGGILHSMEGSVYAVDLSKIPPENLSKHKNGFTIHKGDIPENAIVPLGEYKDTGVAFNTHKAFVESALASGKPVPAAVLADYPDLAEKYGKTQPTQPAGLPTEQPAVVSPSTESGGLPKTPEERAQKVRSGEMVQDTDGTVRPPRQTESLFSDAPPVEPPPPKADTDTPDPGQRLTALNRESMNAARALRGNEEALIGREPIEDADNMRKAIEEGYFESAMDTIKDLGVDKKRQVTEKEFFGILAYYKSVEEADTKLLSQYNEAVKSGDIAAQQTIMAEMEQNSNDLSAIEERMNEQASNTGALLRLRRLMIDQNFSPIKLMRRAQAKGAKPSEKEMSEFAELQRKYDEQSLEIDRLLKQMEQERQNAELAKVNEAAKAKKPRHKYESKDLNDAFQKSTELLRSGCGGR